VSIKGGHTDVSIDIVEHRGDWLRPALISLGLVLSVALIYELIVGGIKVEVAGARLIIDASGLVYWWRLATGR
jgi:hypothetical protein